MLKGPGPFSLQPLPTGPPNSKKASNLLHAEHLPQPLNRPLVSVAAATFPQVPWVHPAHPLVPFQAQAVVLPLLVLLLVVCRAEVMGSPAEQGLACG